jgi:hypothetical protein
VAARPCSTYEDLASVLDSAGRVEEARAALQRALELAERKQCLPYADRIRNQMSSISRWL